MKDSCKARLMPIKDTLDVVGGKWKLQIIQDLMFHGKRRFKELQRDVEGITSRVLSAELKQLEQNELVKRDVFNTAPPTVEYTLTEYGYTLKYVITALYLWGRHHRDRILHGSEEMFEPFPAEFKEENEHNCKIAEEILSRKERELL
jgi:DNA-binding HxlR family transcriptional regulator